MPNPFEKTSSVFPEITQAVGDAYDENVTNGTATNVNSSEPDISEMSAQEVQEAKGQGGRVFMTPGFEEIDNRETIRSFDGSFLAAEKLFARIGIKPPTPEEFANVGVDFIALAAKFEEMKEDDELEPILIICPTLPITAGTVKSWKELYRALSDDKSIPENPLLPEANAGLNVNADVSKHNSELFQQEKDKIRANPSIHGFEDRSIGQGAKNVLWTVALVPGTRNPEYLGETRPADKLLTLSQYLTLQAASIQSGQKPIDDSSWTWLDGSFKSELSTVYLAARRGSPEKGRISLDQFEFDTYANTGVRAPVWG